MALDPTLLSNSPVRRHFSDDALRLSSMLEMDASVAYAVNGSFNVNLGAYAMYVTGQGVGNTLDMFDGQDDLALVGLRFGGTFRR